MGTGCFYTGPITFHEVNVPPAIESYTDGTLHCDDQVVDEVENPLCVVSDGQVAFVTASDENRDDLEFHWEGSGSGVIGDATEHGTGFLQTSQVRLYPYELVDGETLTCTVWDESTTRITHSWTIVVYE